MRSEKTERRNTRAKTKLAYLGILLGVAVAGSSYATTITIDPSSANIGVSGKQGGVAATAYVGGQEFKTAGTGYIDPFLREQANRSEQGMNTSEVKNYLNNKQPVDGYTRDLPLGNLATVPYTPAGGQSGLYYQFWLDVNQNMNTQDPLGLISLTSLSVWISDLKLDATALDALRGTPGNVWQMDGGYDIQIPSGTGSGEGDFSLLVPVPANAASLGSYVYLYAGFGEDSGAYGSNDGFEEWRALTGTPLPPVPDASTTLSLLGMALLVIEGFRRKFRG